MSKIVTMHQPNYLPWIGFFSKMKQSDYFVVADTFELGGKNVVNRNKIRTNTGWGYLTIPIGRSFQNTKICDIPLPVEPNWKELHWKLIYDSYAKARFFDSHKEFFKGLYKNNFEYLWQINMEIIFYLLNCFNIKVEIIKASEMNIDFSLQKSDFLIAVLKEAGADTYLSGPSGRKYLETEKFPQNNIELKYFKFEHPVYSQRFPNFEPNMSAIDLLFNMGPQSVEIIEASGTLES